MTASLTMSNCEGTDFLMGDVRITATVPDEDGKDVSARAVVPDELIDTDGPLVQELGQRLIWVSQQRRDKRGIRTAAARNKFLKDLLRPGS